MKIELISFASLSLPLSRSPCFLRNEFFIVLVSPFSVVVSNGSRWHFRDYANLREKSSRIKENGKLVNLKVYFISFCNFPRKICGDACLVTKTAWKRINVSRFAWIRAVSVTQLDVDIKCKSSSSLPHLFRQLKWFWFAADSKKLGGTRKQEASGSKHHKIISSWTFFPP